MILQFLLFSNNLYLLRIVFLVTVEVWVQETVICNWIELDLCSYCFMEVWTITLPVKTCFLFLPGWNFSVVDGDSVWSARELYSYFFYSWVSYFSASLNNNSCCVFNLIYYWVSSFISSSRSWIVYFSMLSSLCLLAVSFPETFAASNNLIEMCKILFQISV